MAAIIQNWKTFVAVGCVHSTFSCKVALDNVMAFVEDYAPTDRIDLGDVHDYTSLRGGAHGTNDELASLQEDFDAGVEWLKRFRPTKRVLGNHDHRVMKMLNDRSAIKAHCAAAIVEAVRKVDEENGTEVRPYHMKRGHFNLGGTIFAHGWMYNEQFVRDHAEYFGAPCVIAHGHVPHTVPGRTMKSTFSGCVGTLADPDLMGYAETRRNTQRWAHGLIYGPYSDKSCHINLLRADCMHGDFEDWGAMA